MIKELYARVRSRGLVKAIYLLLVLIVITTGLVAYLRYKDSIAQIAIDEAQRRQLVLARSGASSIEDFIRNTTYHLKYISRIDAVASLDEKETRSIFNDFINGMKGTPIGGITRIDDKGIMKIVINREGIRLGEGEDFSDREYFSWAKKEENKDKVYISQPFVSRAGVNKGKTIIILVSPTYFENKFTGMVGISVPVENFSENFVKPIAIYKDFETYLLSNDRVVIAGSSPSLVGVNQTALVSTLQDIQGKEEGSTVTEERILSFHKVNVDGNSWILIVGMPKDLTLSRYLFSSYSFGQYWIFVSLGGVLLGLIFSLMLEHISHRDGYIRGYMDGKLESKKEKS